MLRKTSIAAMLLAAIVVSGCGIILAKDEVPALGEELNPSGTFENVRDGLPVGYATSYMGDGGATIVADNTIARSGEWSVQITSNGERRPALTRQIRNLEGGATYRLGVWYLAEPGIEPDQVSMRVQAFRTVVSTNDKVNWQEDWVLESGATSTVAVVSGNMSVRPVEITAGQWGHLEVTFTLPAEVSLIYVELFNNYGVGSVWYDDLSLRQVLSDY